MNNVLVIVIAFVVQLYGPHFGQHLISAAPLTLSSFNELA